MTALHASATRRPARDVDEPILDAAVATVCFLIAVASIIGCVALAMPR